MSNHIDIATRRAILRLNKAGHSYRQISSLLGIHRQTVKKYVHLGEKKTFRTAIKGDSVAKKQLLKSTRAKPQYGSCVTLLPMIESDLALGLSIKMIYQSLQKDHGFQGSYYSVRRCVQRLKKYAPLSSNVRLRWMAAVINGKKSLRDLRDELGCHEELSPLLKRIQRGKLKERNQALTVISRLKGIPNVTISEFLGLNRRTTAGYFKIFIENGASGLFAVRPRGIRKVDDPSYVDAVVSILHSPPSSHGINRTTWKQDDLRRIVTSQGLSISKRTIRAILKKQGYKWRKARRVLTSNDPQYKAKVEKITSILSSMAPRDRFFSVDEYGPFHITLKGGRRLVAPGEEYTVPQWPKSKGSLIVTAALELCTNQITHFYSESKNTNEIIWLLDRLLTKYAGMETLYLSWDAASWHLSKRLEEKVADINATSEVHSAIPRVILVPLPAGAQFLNVIESVFSGMARAIIHNSDYQCKEAAMQAIDRYFEERNAAFKANPRRAGKKSWGKERVKPVFSEGHNCKDPYYQ